MSMRCAQWILCSLLPVLLVSAGCGGTEGPDDDAPPLIDAPSLDAPSLDAPSLDAPLDASADVATDAPAVTCDGPEACDDGLYCTQDLCFEGVCSHPPRVCADDYPCATGVTCNEALDACVPSLAGSTVECRPSAGPCDVAERCTGTSPDCPDDAFQSDTVICRASAGVCDKAESCTGSTAACPVDLPVVDGTECDVACGLEVCMAGVCTGGSTCRTGRVCLCDEVCGLPGEDCP